MTGDLSTVAPEVSRDRWGRPLIVPLGGGKPVAYTRATTFVGAFEDTYNLEQWKMRQAAIGLSLRPDLQLAVVAAREDKKRLNDICQEALDAAASSAGATAGTAMHSITEAHDRGQKVEGLPPEAAADLAAYAAATVGFAPIYIEQIMVHDEFKVAGTPDRVVEYRGKRYIADLKTGNIDFGAGKIAAQLAMYAHSVPYDVDTGARLEPHGASLDKGLVIHLPVGTGTCEVKWVDLRAGWEIAKVCKDVRAMRALKHTQLFTPLEGKTDRTLHQILAGPGLDPIKTAILETSTRDELNAVWSRFQGAWTDEHTAFGRAHLEATA